MKKNLTLVAPELDVNNNPAPEPVQNDLAQFLNTNDCTTAADKDSCYVRTRLVLIKMGRRIDFLSGRLYVAKATINNLVNNLNEVISGFNSIKVKQAK